MKDADLDLAAADSTYAELQEKYAAMQAKEREAATAERAAQEEMRRLLSSPNGSSDIPRAVAELLEESETDGARAASERLRQAQKARQHASQACEVVKKRLNRQAVVASRTICERIRPEYEKRTREVGMALIALGEAIARHEELKHKLNAAGVRWAELRPAGLPRVGSKADPNSWIRCAVEDFIQAGALKTSDLPKGWAAQARAAGPGAWGRKK